ncbi:hypothetical protein [Sphingomonas ginkgonis]|uniref:hypothetical protein n=1 Tax=Sphingomonas ginkgonis TaxID=2315330 RepID=UPI001EF15283|nr:hypothetical protein [Sphingomonas ginkgonis]
MFQYNLDAFEAVQNACAGETLGVAAVVATPTTAASEPLMAGTSLLSVTRALLCQDYLNALLGLPEAEQSGQVLLGSTDFCDVSNVHLWCPRVRFLTVPKNAPAMAERINWMWHAGSLRTDADLFDRSIEAIDIMVGQVAPHGEFDPETLADDLFHLSADHAEIVDALFHGDLDDVPDLIDEADAGREEELALVQAAAWTYVCWSGFEGQRQACYGWRQKHRPLDGVWDLASDKPVTIGQLFRPRLKQHEFASEMKDLYEANVASGTCEVTDKRTINSIERRLKEVGLGFINRKSEKEMFAAFGAGRAACLVEELKERAVAADFYQCCYRADLKSPGGKSRAGKHADALFARISCVDRLAVVVARTCHLAELARHAKTSDDLRAMLNAHLPGILRPQKDKRDAPEKQRMRQLYHVLRIEFLRDGEHWSKAEKKQPRDKRALPALELSEAERQRGHEIFDRCWRELRRQPSDWRFLSPFGWSYDGRPRVRFSAPR